MTDDTKDTKDDEAIEAADSAVAENNDADDANPDAEPQQPEIPFGIVYDDETDDKPGSPDAAEAGGRQPAMDQTDRLVPRNRRGIAIRDRRHARLQGEARRSGAGNGRFKNRPGNHQ